MTTCGCCGQKIRAADTFVLKIGHKDNSIRPDDVGCMNCKPDLRPQWENRRSIRRNLRRQYAEPFHIPKRLKGK